MSEHTHVIRKGGFFYRPKACGYTQDILEAGRWTKVEAAKHVNEEAGVTIHPFSNYWPPKPSTQTSELIDRLTRENEAMRLAMKCIANNPNAPKADMVSIARTALALLKEPS